MSRVTVGVARLRTLTTQWPWVPSIHVGQNLQPFTGNDDLSKWVKNSQVGRKTPTNKQSNKQRNKQRNKQTTNKQTTTKQSVVRNKFYDEIYSTGSTFDHFCGLIMWRLIIRICPAVCGMMSNSWICKSFSTNSQKTTVIYFAGKFRNQL